MGKKMNKRKTSFTELIQFFLYWFDGQFAGGDYVIYKLICFVIGVQYPIFKVLYIGFVFIMYKIEDVRDSE